MALIPAYFRRMFVKYYKPLKTLKFKKLGISQRRHCTAPGQRLLFYHSTQAVWL